MGEPPGPPPNFRAAFFGIPACNTPINRTYPIPHGQLAQITHSPIVELNRAVAVGMAFGPQAGLDLVDSLAAEPLLESYHLLPSVRGDLLAKVGRWDEARDEFQRAAALTRNSRERDLLLRRAAECGPGRGSEPTHRSRDR